jgi:hypothetical protein
VLVVGFCIDALFSFALLPLSLLLLLRFCCPVDTYPSCWCCVLLGCCCWWSFQGSLLCYHVKVTLMFQLMCRQLAVSLDGAMWSMPRVRGLDGPT